MAVRHCRAQHALRADVHPPVVKGHIGGLTLAYPCAWGTFLSIIPLVLQCVCIHCSSLLVPRTNPRIKHLQKLNICEDVGYIKAIRLVAKESPRVCNTNVTMLIQNGSDVQKIQRQCCTSQPLSWTCHEHILFRPKWKKDDANRCAITHRRHVQ